MLYATCDALLDLYAPLAPAKAWMCAALVTGLLLLATLAWFRAVVVRNRADDDAAEEEKHKMIDTINELETKLKKTKNAMEDADDRHRREYSAMWQQLMEVQGKNFPKLDFNCKSMAALVDISCQAKLLLDESIPELQQQLEGANKQVEKQRNEAAATIDALRLIANSNLVRK